MLTFAVYRPDLPADASVEQRVEATAGWDDWTVFQSFSLVDPEYLHPFFSVGYTILKCIKADDEFDNLA